MQSPPISKPTRNLLPTSESTASSPDIATLLERFDEPLRDGTRPAAADATSAVAAMARRFAPPQAKENGAAASPEPAPAPAAKERSSLSRNALVSAVVLLTLVPLAILFVQLWQDMPRPRGGQEMAPAGQSSAARTPATTVVTRKTQDQITLEVALSAPNRIDANGGGAVAFPIIIDATAALPARSIVAVTALPGGASFSQGRPYGDNGWSLSPDELTDLRLQLPAQSAASDLRLELIAGDGTVLARSTTQVSIAASPPAVATVDFPETSAPGAVSEQITQTGAIESAPPEQVAQAEPAEPVADPPPPPRNPSSPAENDATPKVNKVKVVTIKPPGEKRPYDGAYALGAPADEPDAPGEWMQTKTAVDMHAKAQQSSETVKIAQGGLRVRVTARDKNWVQVTDPKTSTTGWIYNRFLKPIEAPTQ